MGIPHAFFCVDPIHFHPKGRHGPYVFSGSVAVIDRLEMVRFFILLRCVRLFWPPLSSSVAVALARQRTTLLEGDLGASISWVAKSILANTIFPKNAYVGRKKR